jgi:hypothetical protein
MALTWSGSQIRGQEHVAVNQTGVREALMKSTTLPKMPKEMLDHHHLRNKFDVSTTSPKAGTLQQTSVSFRRLKIQIGQLETIWVHLPSLHLWLYLRTRPRVRTPLRHSRPRTTTLRSPPTRQVGRFYRHPVATWGPIRTSKPICSHRRTPFKCLGDCRNPQINNVSI